MVFLHMVQVEVEVAQALVVVHSSFVAAAFAVVAVVVSDLVLQLLSLDLDSVQILKTGSDLTKN